MEIGHLGDGEVILGENLIVPGTGSLFTIEVTSQILDCYVVNRLF